MTLFPQCVLTTAYFPPVEYFFAIANSGKVLIEQHEIYQKQSYRTRCNIYSTAGAEALSVPVLRDGTHKVPIRDIRIDYSEPWLQRHKRAMTAAYNSSAFFEYYADELFAILDRREHFLMDLNCLLLEKLIGMAGIRADIGFTDRWEESYAEGDFRVRIQPKYRGVNLMAEMKKEKTYFQVFSPKSGFVPNLSIIDLLSAEGPDAISYLL